MSDPVDSLWRPDEFGLIRSTLLSAVLVTLLVAGLIAARRPTDPPDLPPPMTVHLVELSPAPEPDSAPEVTAPPAQASAAPALVLPERPIEAQPLSIPRPAPAAIRNAPRHPSPPRIAAGTSLPGRPPTALPATPDPPAPPLDTSSGIGPYRTGLHLQIERNIAANSDIEAIGATGTAVIEAVIRPDGQILSARIARNSRSRDLDRAALAALQRGGFPPFGPHMPATPITISVPITLTN